MFPILKCFVRATPRRFGGELDSFIYLFHQDVLLPPTGQILPSWVVYKEFTTEPHLKLPGTPSRMSKRGGLSMRQ